MCTACTECLDLIKAIDAYIAKADEELIERLRAEGFADPEETVKHINDLEEQVAEVLQEQNNDFEKVLKNVIAIITAGSFVGDAQKVLFDMFEKFKLTDDISEKLFQVFYDEFSDYIPKLSNVYMSDLDPGLVVDQITHKTTDWITQWSYDLANLMNLNTHTDIERILKRGLESGKGIPEIARDILDDGIRNTYYEAKRVAQTEILRAHSVSRNESIMQSPATEFKEWVHTGSYRNKPRENHVDISGQIVPKNQTFTLYGKSGVHHPEYPLDSSLPAEESINCHCYHRGITSDKIMGLPLEERKRLQQETIDEMNKDYDPPGYDNKENYQGNCNWIRRKSLEDRKKFFRSDSRWALFESGVIQNDADLEKLYKTVKTSKGERKVFKSLTELKNDGIITVSKDRLEHSVLGDWTKTNRLEKGGHGQRGMEKLLETKFDPVIYKEYSNGVRIGSVPGHKQQSKKTGSDKPNSDIGQAWFPENWDDDKILLAGTYTANTGTGEGITRFAVYDGVEVVVFLNDNQVGTICPNNMKQPKGDEWENARD